MEGKSYTEEENQKEQNNGGNVISQYFTFSKEIKALGSEFRMGDIKGLKSSFITACVFFVLLIIAIIVVPSIPLDKANDIPFILLDIKVYNSSRIVLIGILSLCSIGFMWHSYKISTSDYCEELRSNKADRHSKIVEYMVRYFLIKGKVLEAKYAKVDDEGLEKELKLLNNSEIAKKDCGVTIDHLIDKVEKEWHSYEEKMRRSVLLTFAVALATSGMATIKELASVIVWNYGFDDHLAELEKSLVALIGNATAFFVFIFLVFLIRNIKDTIDSSTSVKSRNMEYAYYALKTIKEKSSRGDDKSISDNQMM